MTLTIRKEGEEYENFVKASVERNFETAAATFSFTATASEDDQLPIQEGDKIEVIADGKFKILTGYVDEVEVIYEYDSHEIEIRGRSITSDFIDGTVGVIKEFETINLVDLCKEVLSSMSITNIEVINQAGDIADFEDISSAETGQTGFGFVEAYARKRQVMITVDGDGNLLLARASSELSGNSLKNVIGATDNNVKKSRKKTNIAALYNKYIAQSQLSPIDLAEELTPQELSEQVGIAIDSEIRETRTLEFYTEETTESFTLEDRAKWELSLRRARNGLVYITTVQGHSFNDEVWEPNKLHQIDDDMCKIHDQLLCNKVFYTYSVKSGSETTLSFTSKRAYTLEADKDKILQSEDF